VSATAGRGYYDRWGKRWLDVVLATIAVGALLPVFALVAAAVFMSLGSPVLFTQHRAGRRGTPFLLRKFRTMSDARDERGELLPDADRLTALGRFLRRCSLDELPEFWHVLRGEMSLVGPRPLPVRYVERYTPIQARRLEVKPGITGLAQVRGRNALSWEQKFEHDVWYVDHRTLRLDLWLLIATVGVVVAREGVSHPGQATMHEFLGSAQ
jgi:sugar transferase EpsL